MPHIDNFGVDTDQDGPRDSVTIPTTVYHIQQALTTDTRPSFSGTLRTPPTLPCGVHALRDVYVALYEDRRRVNGVNDEKRTRRDVTWENLQIALSRYAPRGATLNASGPLADDRTSNSTVCPSRRV